MTAFVRAQDFLATRYFSLLEIFSNIIITSVMISFWLSLRRFSNNLNDFIFDNKTRGSFILAVTLYHLLVIFFIVTAICVGFSFFTKSNLSKTRKKSRLLLIIVIPILWWYLNLFITHSSVWITVVILFAINYISWLILEKIRSGTATTFNFPALSDKHFSYLIFSLAALFFLYFSFWTLRKHFTYHTGIDLGIFDQLLFQLSRFDNTFSSIENADHFKKVHFSPGLALLVPIYWLFPNSSGLLVIQVLFLAFSGLLLFILAKKITGYNWIGVILVMSYFLHPGIHHIISCDFHEIFIIPFLILGIFYAVECQKWRIFWILIVLTLMMKEDGALYIAFIGIYILLFYRNFKLGILTLLTGGIYFFISTHFLLSSVLLDRYQSFFAEGYEGMLALVVTFVTNPLYFLKYYFSDESKLYYWVLLLTPVIFLPLFSRSGLLLLIPGLFLSVLTFYYPLYSIYYYYAATILPFIYFLAIVGLKKIDPKYYLSIGILILFNSILLNLNYGLITNNELLKPISINSDVTKVLRMIPDKASVACANNYLPHLSHRDSLFLFPNVQESEYIIFDRFSETWPLPKKQEGYHLIRQLFDQHYAIEAFFPGVILLKKNGKDHLKKFKNIFYGFLLDTNCGEYVDDSTSTYKQAIVGNVEKINGGEPSLLVWGPFIKLLPGIYESRFRLKIQPSSFQGKVATLDVFSGTSATLVNKDITTQDFDGSDYTTFKVPFEIKEVTDNLEFRVLYYGNIQLKFDYIEVVKIN